MPSADEAVVADVETLVGAVSFMRPFLTLLGVQKEKCVLLKSLCRFKMCAGMSRIPWL